MKLKEQHSLTQAAERSGLSPDLIVRFISFEWIIPSDRSNDLQHQTLDDEDLARIFLIKQLQEEFGVNDESIPIILHLIDQLNRTHLEVRRRFLDP
jgi:DNA-binding transcriptional MerR regulator